MAAISVTLELDEDLVRRAETASDGDLTGLVSKALLAQLQSEHAAQLRADLIAGCVEDAQLDLDICREWEPIDSEMFAREPW